MYIKAEIPSVRKINVEAYERYKALYDSDEPLPYKEVVETYLKGHDVAHTVLGKEGRNYLLEFGKYLQKSNVIYQFVVMLLTSCINIRMSSMTLN